MKLQKKRLTLAVTGIFLGLLIFFGHALIVSISVLSLIFFFIARRPEEERDVLLPLVISALILRVFFFSLTLYIVHCANSDLSQYPADIVGHTVQVVRDFDREIKNGIQIERYLRGEFGDIPIKEVSHHGFGFLHTGAWTQGILNLVFGRSMLNLLLFPVLDIWSLLLLFFAAKSLFNQRVALFSACIYGFMPSFIIISATNIRFCMGILSFLLIMFSLINFAKHNNARSLCILCLSAVLFYIYKDKAGKLLFLILPLCVFMALNIGFRKKLIICSAAFIMLVCVLQKSTHLQSKVMTALQNLISSQKGFNMGVDAQLYSNYKIYDDFVYHTDEKTLELPVLLQQTAKGLVRGMWHFFLAPFPWETRNILRLYYYPQNMFWYIVFPFSIVGMFISLFRKHKAHLTLPVALLVSFFAIILSLTIGNEGIAIRYRDLLTPFFYIFAGSVLCRLT